MSDKLYLCESFDFDGDALCLLQLFRNEPHAFFLDSSQLDPHRGRYSFVGFDPFETFVSKGKETLDQLKEKFDHMVGDNAERFSCSLTPLTSGIIGCLNYDYGLHQEKIRLRSHSDPGLPDCFFGFYDCVITIDHFTQKLHITSSGLPETNRHICGQRARQRLAAVKDKIVEFLTEPRRVMNGGANVDAEKQLEFECNLSKSQYMNAVARALDHIACGDIYQVNLSRRFRYGLEGKVFDPFKFYSALRDHSPSPFGGYLDCGDYQLMSNSPERFLRLNKRVVQSRPMKGTRPRGANETEDRRLHKEITNSAKEKAELMMITDLIRNDLGRVCEYGSINVREMRTIEEYKYVFQATSTVEGLLQKDKDCFDLIRACFPGGSITGCPKIRAMEVIEELEPTKRGVYTGSMGYINCAGNMDLNILIRTLLKRRDQLVFQVGGGIVADSTPEKEYRETMVKASAIKRCLANSLTEPEPVLNAE